MTYGQIDFSVQTNGATASFTLTKQGNFYESISWDFGDGTKSQGTNSTVSHTYTTLGNYTVCVIGYPMPMATNDTMCKTVSITTNTIKASSCGSYTLNGKTYDKTGLYTQTLKDILGNDSIVTLDLTINSLPPYTGIDKTICLEPNTETNITLTGSNGQYSFKWSTNDGNILSTTSSISIKSPLVAGSKTYYCTVTDNTTSCNKIISSTINYIASPSISWDANNQNTICSNGNPVLIKVNTPVGFGSFSGFTSKTVTLNSILIDPKTSSVGTYNLTYSFNDAMGCSASINTQISITSTLPPTTEADSLNTYLLNMIPPFYIKAVGTMLKWYSDSKCTNYIGSGSPFNITNYASNNGKGQYFYVTQTLNSCESKPDSIFVYNMTNCPWKAPIVVSVNKCENDNSLYSTPVIASIPTQTPQPNMVNWEWYSNEGLTTKIASATGSSYLPMNIQSETYYVRYSAIEPSSGMACWSPASKVTRTVNPKPIPQFANSVKSDYCNYDNFIVLNGIDSKGLTGVNTYKVDNKLITSSVISIETQKSDILYTVEFVRTSVDGCKDSVKKQIKVHCLTAPTISAPNPKTIVIDDANNLSEPANLSAMGTGNNEIQWMDASCTTVHSTGNTLVTDLSVVDLGAVPSKSFIYKVRQMESVSGCVSNCVDQQLILINCPALAPIVVDPYYCVNDPLALTAIAIPQGTQGSGDKLVWYPTSTTGGYPISGFDGVNVYTSSIAKTAPITETVYVAQYNKQYNCYSSPKKVTINVVANPTVNISVPKDVCSADGKVDINVSGNGVLLGDDSGLDASAHTWDPGILSTATKTIILSYTVTETQADGQTCSTTKSTSITAHFVETPLTEDKTWSIGDIANIPVNFLTANSKGTGVKINWYADQNKIALLSTTNNYTPDKVAIQAEVTAAGNPKTFTKTYWISQTDATGCESDVVAVNLNLVDCPWQAPVVAGIEKCENDPTLASSALVATIPTQSPQQPDEAKVTWEWYADASLMVSSKIQTAISSTYIPTNIPTNYFQTITYYVRYSAIEPSSGKSCWSPASPVVYKINPKPSPQFENSVNSDYCYNDKTGLIVLNGSDIKALPGTDVFNVTKNGVTKNAAVINIGTPIADEVFNIEYVRTTESGCKDSVHKDITVHYIATPTVVSSSSTLNPVKCIYEATPSFNFTSNTNNSNTYEFNIYTKNPHDFPNEQKITSVQANQSFTPSNVNNAGTYEYWITELNIDNQCMSQAQSFTLTTKETLSPIATAISPICEAKNTSVTLNVNSMIGAEVYWYDSLATQNAEPINNFKQKGNPYIVDGTDKLSTGTYTYYASQVIGGCQSAKTAVTFSIVASYNDTLSVTINKGDSTKIGSLYYKTADTLNITYNSSFGCDSLMHYIISVKIIGDTNNDGTIDDTETAGDIDGDGIINNGEICGDVNGNKIIDATEIAGDINGNGVIDNLETAEKAGFRNEIAGDLNGDGEITAPEIVGDINGNGTIDSKTEALGDVNGNGTIDLNETTGIAIIGKTNISVYPSPTKSMIYIKSNKTIKINKVEIWSVLGNIVQEGNLNADTKGISIQSLPSGLYIIKIFTEGKIYSQKIIKE